MYRKTVSDILNIPILGKIELGEILNNTYIIIQDEKAEVRVCLGVAIDNYLIAKQSGNQKYEPYTIVGRPLKLFLEGLDDLSILNDWVIKGRFTRNLVSGLVTQSGIRIVTANEPREQLLKIIEVEPDLRMEEDLTDYNYQTFDGTFRY